MKKHLFKSMVGAVAALSLSFGLAACGSGGSSSGATGEKSIVTVYNVEPQNKMIPGNVNENAGARVLDLIFAGLVTFDRNGIPHNEVAQSIKASKNNTSTSRADGNSTMGPPSPPPPSPRPGATRPTRPTPS